MLKAWEGAGYYARARRLHSAARLLVRTNGGRVPRSAEALERLPGVGRYTARAIASLAFGAPVVALEANGVRVVARWTREEGDLRTPRVRARLATALAKELPESDPGPFNESVMELGETVCLPRTPRCPACPVAFACRAFCELPDPSRIPRRVPRRPRPHLYAAVVVLTDPRSRWLVQRRPARGLLGGLWEFPGGKVEPGESPESAARRELKEETGAGVGRLTGVGVVHHGYSHFTVELHVFQGNIGSRGPTTSRTRRWVTPPELDRLPVPGATRKIVRLLSEGDGPRRATLPAGIAPAPGRGTLVDRSNRRVGPSSPASRRDRTKRFPRSSRGGRAGVAG